MAWVKCSALNWLVKGGLDRTCVSGPDRICGQVNADKVVAGVTAGVSAGSATTVVGATAGVVSSDENMRQN